MNRMKAAMSLQTQNTPPIWFMRQAGRYHSHYQALRTKYSFDQLCRTPELAMEVAMGPIEAFDFDAAILFSDILYPLDALGLGLTFSDKGPQFAKTLSGETWNQLVTVEEAWPKLNFQGEAVKQTRAALPRDKALLGFVGGLWTLWTFALGRNHNTPIQTGAKDLENWPRYTQLLRPLLERCIADQLKCGADFVCVFDSSAGLLPAEVFQRIVLPDMKYLAQKFPRQILYYSKGTTPHHLEDVFWRSGELLGLGFDQNWRLRNELTSAGRTTVVQGNFDQSHLLLEANLFDRELERYLRPFLELSPDQRKGWILGLGHGITPKTPERNVRRFVDYSREVFG